MNASSPITTQSDTNANVFVIAHEKCLPMMLAIPAEKLRPVNYEIPWATTAVLGSLGEIMQYRDDASRLPFFQVSNIDNLKDVTLALSHANALYQAACEPSDELKPLNDKALLWRNKLTAVLQMLVTCGLLNPEVLSRTSGLTGYRNVATDVQILCSVMINNWRQIAGKCPLERADVDAAANLAATILTTYGIREQGPASVEATADIRTRASTLFWEHWSETRRAIHFLRWGKGDADTIAPPLAAPRKRNTGEEPETPAEPSVPDAPNTNPGGSPFIE